MRSPGTLARHGRWAHLLLGALAIVPLVPGIAVAETTLERIQQSNHVRIGVANEAPYGYVDEDGRLTGEAPEIARRILQKIDPDIDLEPVVVDFGELIPRLRAGDIDIIAAGMFVTPARCAQIRFSEPTYVIGESFLVRKGNPKNVTSYESISRNNDARVGLIAGTVEYNYAMYSGIPSDRAPLYRSFAKAVEALQSGAVDAVGMTSLTARSFAREAGNSDLAATSQFYPVIRGTVEKGYGAFGFRKQDSDLAEAFDQHLADFIGTEAHWDLVEPFGFAPDMKPDQTTESLCGNE